MADAVYPDDINAGDTGHRQYHIDHKDDTQDHHHNVLHPQHVDEFPDWSDASPADGAVPEWDSGTSSYVPTVGTAPSGHGSTHAPDGSDPIATPTSVMFVAVWDATANAWQQRATVTDVADAHVVFLSFVAGVAKPDGAGEAIAGQDIVIIPDSAVTVTATIAVTSLTVTLSGTTATAVLDTSTVGSVTADEWAVTVRAAVNPVDSGVLDFPHQTGTAFAGTQSFTASQTLAAGNYNANFAYKIGGTWTHDLHVVAFTVGTPAPAPSSGNPFGTVAARSAMAWNSGVWALDRSGSAASYTSAQKYAENGTTGRGVNVDLEMSAQYNNGSWGDLTGLQILDFLTDYAGPIPIVMLPPFIPGGSWAAAANGDYDSYYQQIGAAIASKQAGKKTVLRLAWEMNGNWYPHSIVNIGGTSAHMASVFIAGWQRAVSKIRVGAGSEASNIIFDYSLSALDDKSGNGTLHPLNVCYPGDSFVDVIGIDYYDWQPKTTSATVPGRVDMLNEALEFTNTHGKYMSLDEWGLHHTGAGGEGGDNANHIKAMFAWFEANKDSIAWESYFQDDAAGNVNSSLFSPDANNNPLSKAAYLALMP